MFASTGGCGGPSEIQGFFASLRMTGVAEKAGVAEDSIPSAAALRGF
ncbi:hypothetical protein [Edaphobacter modestus]|nr:hypothetical protein [Edaphobacter modestus]